MEYKYWDRQEMKRKFMNGNNQTITAEIIRVLTGLKDTGEVKKGTGLNMGKNNWSTMVTKKLCLKDYKKQIAQYCLWGANVQSYASFGRKMIEFLNRWNKINTPYVDKLIMHKFREKPEET